MHLNAVERRMRRRAFRICGIKLFPCDIQNCLPRLLPDAAHRLQVLAPALGLRNTAETQVGLALSPDRLLISNSCCVSLRKNSTVVGASGNRRLRGGLR